ncbi:MAG: TonB-dependent receptor [Bacteroidales bacterium]|nr:TonB-dependent receptor [Bacteroidales bacterium]
MKRQWSQKALAFVLMLVMMPLLAFAQDINVKGTVSDILGDGMPGVNIIQQGTTNGTISDIDGNFTLKVPQGSMLEISFIGYRKKVIEAKSNLSVTLEEDKEMLDEVVVVGYGTAKKSDVTGSIASVKEATLKEVPAANAAAALQGRVAGVQIKQTSTHPGQESQIRIRGTRSLTASNDPLIVLDGIPFSGTLSDIAPDDIKSMDILKDASATAIYGSRGANGVILISTNKSKGAQKAKVTYNGYVGVGNAMKTYKVFNAKEYLQYKAQPGNTAWGFAEQEDQSGNTNTNWQDELYRTSVTQSHDISIAGGNDAASASGGINYYKTEAIVPGQDFSRISGRLNSDFKIGTWGKMGFSTRFGYSITNGETSNVLGAAILASPLLPAYNPDGSINAQPWGNSGIESAYSPLLFKDKSLWSEERRRFTNYSTAYFETKLGVDWLRYRVNAGFNYSQDQYGNFFASESAQKSGGVSSAKEQNVNTFSYDVENLIYFDKSFGKHTIGATAMFSAEETTYTMSQYNASDMVADYQKWYNMGNSAGVSAGSPNRYKRGLLSWMLRANYAYDGRYLATVTWRADGSSVLSEGHKWHSYPAVSLAWNIKNEAFMQDINWLDNLKLRVGYGQTSNQSVAPYSTLAKLNPVKYNFGSGGNYIGYYPSSLANENVGWEYTSSWNYGIDFSVLNGRISGTLDGYAQKTTDLLVNQALPVSSGSWSTILTNIGETKNVGFEATLHTENIVPQQKDGFAWSMDMNLGINRNELTKLQDGVERNEANGWFVGQPIDVIYDYEKLGIWQKGEETEAAKYGRVPGDIKIKDQNNDGKIDAEDKTFVGSMEPDFEYGWTNHFNYKNFDLDIVTYGQVGGTLISTIYQKQLYINQLNGRRNNIWVNYWREDNPTNDFPRVDSNESNDNFKTTTGYYSATYFKIQNITLGYTFPEKLISPLHLSYLRIYASCNNVAYLFSPYMHKTKGISPEATSYYSEQNGVNSYSTNKLIVGLDTPAQRQWMVGLSVKF